MVESRIKEIYQKDNRTLAITWTDSKQQFFDVVDLRKSCPCALCTDEHTGKRKLDPKRIEGNVRPIAIQSVGRYALNIKFSDGHQTGIYTFDKLRRMIPSSHTRKTEK